MESQILLKREPKLALSTLVWTKLARTITNLTSPPFLAIPTLLGFDYYYQERQGGTASLFRPSQIIALFFGIALPIFIIIVLRLLHKIDDIHVSLRKQRTVPFICAIVSYALGAALLSLRPDGAILATLLFGYASTTLIVMLINFRWKISVHATGLGGPLAAITLLLGWIVLPLFLLIPVVGWARVYLKAHTLAQVVAGSLFGYFSILFQLAILFRY
jgi:membrane-associated phospholipid phosphatase